MHDTSPDLWYILSNHTNFSTNGQKFGHLLLAQTLHTYCTSLSFFHQAFSAWEDLVPIERLQFLHSFLQSYPLLSSSFLQPNSSKTILLRLSISYLQKESIVFIRKGVYKSVSQICLRLSTDDLLESNLLGKLIAGHQKDCWTEFDPCQENATSDWHQLHQCHRLCIDP